MDKKLAVLQTHISVVERTILEYKKCYFSDCVLRECDWVPPPSQFIVTESPWSLEAKLYRLAKITPQNQKAATVYRKIYKQYLELQAQRDKLSQSAFGNAKIPHDQK